MISRFLSIIEEGKTRFWPQWFDEFREELEVFLDCETAEPGPLSYAFACGSALVLSKKELKKELWAFPSFSKALPFSFIKIWYLTLFDELFVLTVENIGTYLLLLAFFVFGRFWREALLLLIFLGRRVKVAGSSMVKSSYFDAQDFTNDICQTDVIFRVLNLF